MRLPTLALSTALSALLTVGCASGPPPTPPAVTLVTNVDMQRFVGDWYVIASIPTPPEKGAFNARESYALSGDGAVAIHFTYNVGTADGPRKTIDSKGFPDPAMGNAVWGVQFYWPFKADYRISYLADDYSQTVITRQKRDYVWIMARTPTMSKEDLARLTAFVGVQGYDVSKLMRVTQETR